MALSPWPIGTPLLEGAANAPWQRWFSNLVVIVNGLVDGVKSGLGSPETVVTGSVGDLYRRLDGGANTTLYIKESGAATKTGWVAK